ncbi:T9SS type B sorting domain-containing protein [Algibacter aquimarinus]|uniref:T9SS type B sorting domain-containing protein n=1 Tax=Algibacter aquimarinus TaxID=1136748 RepID=A0ABP9HS09_9FLAO
MKQKIFLLIIILTGAKALSQNQAANWYFGENAGLSFNLDTNSVSITTDGRLNTREGCSSISDDSGNLLFYTDGITVWNKNHVTMANGSGLFGDPSSSQSAIIVPKPESSNIYYIFTVDNNLNGFNFGLNYSEVDITLDNGLGAVTDKNTNLLGVCSEKITAVLKDCISGSIWVLAYASKDGTEERLYDTFHAFEVSPSGVDSNSVKTTLTPIVSDGRGYLKLSPDGKKIASANVRDGLFIYDFDVSTGTLTNKQTINLSDTNGNIFPYGVEFSPNSNLLYVHSSNDFFDFDDPSNGNIPSNHTSILAQFDLSNNNPSDSRVIIDERQLYRGALQLGPNGKIYRALSATYNEGLPFLGVIENPNTIGRGCNYIHNAINLTPFNSSQGLPPFISSFFNTEIDIIKNGESSINLALCDGDKYTLISENISGASYIWTLDGVPLTETDFDLEVSKSGHYQVYIDPNNGDCAFEGQAFVVYNQNPEAFNHTILQCDEDDIIDGFTTFNLNEANPELTNNNSNLSTRFYTDIARTNQINGSSFSNISNPQIIYVEVYDTNTNCYDISELEISVSTTDSNDVSITICDDDGVEDGFQTFNLSEVNSQIVNGLPNGLNISYFETYEDSLLEQNDLGSSFTNTIPYNQTIYARVENANNCYGISEISLKVDELPNIEIESSNFYCLNNFPKPIIINAGVINDSPSKYTYLWSSGETTYNIEINEPGEYNVLVTNSNGCSKSRKVNIEPSNLATFNAIDVIDVTDNNTITVMVSGEGIYEYALFKENNNLIIPYQENNIFENVSPGIYSVSVKDVKNNCGSVEQNVSVIGFPKFFTPNNDGINDTWQVYGVSSMFQPNSKILIYNRYGKLVQEINPLGQGWNGTSNGIKLPSDDYWFSITLQDGRIFKNHFTLKY